MNSICIKKCLYGQYALFDKNVICFFMNTYGYFAKFEIEFFRTFLHDNDNVIEIGSFIGTHAIPIKQMIKNGTLICFEPQQLIFKLLCTNLMLNNCFDVITLPYGIGMDKYFTTSLDVNISDRFSIINNVNTNNITTQQINCKSISYFSELYENLPNIKLIKIDTEGMEINVLNDLREIIKKFNPFIFVEYNDETLIDMLILFNSLNYECYYFNTSTSTQYDVTNNTFCNKFFVDTENKIEATPEQLNKFGDFNIFAIPKTTILKPHLEKVLLKKEMEDRFTTARINSLEEVNNIWS
jgi:FkbM family methyltransferase